MLFEADWAAAVKSGAETGAREAKRESAELSPEAGGDLSKG